VERPDTAPSTERSAIESEARRSRAQPAVRPEPGEDSSGLLIDGVTAGYGPREALVGVSLHAAPGEMTGLIGPNGSGKTSLVRVAARGLRPRAGRVRVAGQDPYALSARKAARLVSVVPQDVSPAFSFSVMEVVLMGRSPFSSPWWGARQEDWAAARSAMIAADVADLAERSLDELSGGERQRVILAQALAQSAPVLLLDEPTTHLDPRHVVDVLNLVHRLAKEEGRTVLAIFHDLNLASAYCDRIHVLKDGVVVASGPPASVITFETIMEIFGVEAEILPAAGEDRPVVVFSGPRGSSEAGRRHEGPSSPRARPAPDGGPHRGEGRATRTGGG
jgi:iron complex transport system ATP-binding protein